MFSPQTPCPKQEVESPKQEVESVKKEVESCDNQEEEVPVFNLVITRAQKAGNPLKELPFCDVDWEAGPVKPSKSRAQRKRDTFLGPAKLEDVQQMKPSQFYEFDIPSDISSLQQADKT